MKEFLENKNLKYLFHLFNFFVFSFICYWIIENIDIKKIYFNFFQIPFDVFLYVFILNIFLIPLYGERLKVILKCNRKVSNSITVIGFGLSHLLPFKLNEILKLTYSKKLFGIDVHKLISVFIVEKTFDFFILFLIVLFSSNFIVFTYSDNIFLFFFIGLFLCFIIILISYLSIKYKFAIFFFNKWIQLCLVCLKEMIFNKNKYYLFFLTTFIWSLTVLSIHMMFYKLHLNYNIIDSFVITLLIVASVAVPLAPSAFGVFEAAIIYYLQNKFDLDFNLCMTYALSLHMIILIPQLFLCLLVLLNQIYLKR